MGPGPSQGDKKITSALTNEGTERPHGNAKQVDGWRVTTPSANGRCGHKPPEAC
jgi:hypothetical protein